LFINFKQQLYRMKFIILLFLFITALAATAQKTETFYDYYWKPCPAENARYYSIVEKTDSGWLRKDYFVSPTRLQMQALYEDEAGKTKNGHYFSFHANGIASNVGRYIHGKQEGVNTSYHTNGVIADSGLYHNGKVADKRFRWHSNGYMSDSISRVNDSTEVHVGWFDDGQLAFAGYLVNGKENGKWKYYHHNGQVSASEIYSRGKRTSVEYFTEEGQPQTDTSAANREATFKGGDAAWRKYLEKNLYWPSGLKFTTPAVVTLGISFVIDENGKVISAEVSMPFHEEFDKIALRIIKNSPPWLPGAAHNRKVKAYRRQPFSFSQPD
jgi:antitoxin component YwqK of YwqJK toxin-antitoxin module